MRFSFVGGSSALDLVGTVESRQHTPVDLLATPAALEQWVVECAELPDQITADTATLAVALELREAVYQLAIDRVHGRRFEPTSLDVVNEVAAGPVLRAELSDGGLMLSGDMHSALAHVARNGVFVLADPYARLKECRRLGCTRLFLDRSHGERRTWCGMESCGNRVKAASYRARIKASSPS